MRHLVSSLALLLLVSLPSLASAQDPAAAERLFLEGREKWDAGEHQAACDKFAASMAAEQSGGTALNISLCHEHFGRTASAWAELRRAATQFRSSSEPDREKFALEKAAALELRLSKLTIHGPAIEGLEVKRNGTPVPIATFGSAVPVDPGELRIEATAPGYESWSVTVVVEGNADSKTITIPSLTQGEGPGSAPEPDSSPQPDDGPNALVVAGGVMMGVGVVAAVVGGVIGGTVLSDASEAEKDETLCGPDKRCEQKGLDHIAAAEDKAMVANVLIGVGAGVAVGGAVLLAVGMLGDSSEASAFTTSVGPNGAFVRWQARF